MRPRPRILVSLALLAVLLLVGGAGAYFTGLFATSPDEAQVHAEAEESEPAVPVASLYYELPDMLVNLKTGSSQSNLLKISVALEVADETTIDRLQTVMPRVIDNFQVYLRELRVEDLSGSAGLQRLREELLVRVNAATHPVVVSDVLFKEMLVQ